MDGPRNVANELESSLLRLGDVRDRDRFNILTAIGICTAA